ncbi:MAG: multicopper oxidase family protein [Variibacter sp.]|nr:multicopper oxidase family protein [Variibacter sp.]
MAPSASLPLVSCRSAWSRRQVLRAAGLGLAALSVSGGARGQERPRPLTTDDGFRILRAQAASSALRGEDQPSTPTLGFEGLTPVPLLRMRLADELRVRLVNSLAEPTAIHWHGVRQTNAMDGTPHLTQPATVPGAHFDYRVRPRDPGTYWYHATELAADQVARGLYGVLIVEDRDPPQVDREVVLVFDDWRLTSEGLFDPARGTADYVTVNSRPHMTIPVRSNERLRLRLLNAAVSRMMGLRIDGHPMTVLAIDGQPAEPFMARDSRVVLGSGNRVDVLLDAPLGPGVAAPIVMETADGAIPIARLVYQQDQVARARPLEPIAKALPTSLPARMDFGRALKLAVPLDPNATRAALRDPSGRAVASPEPSRPLWTAAGDAMAKGLAEPLFRVARGRTVMLALENPGSEPYAVHVHGHHFRVLDALDDGWKPFWLDTITTTPRQTTRIAFVADEPGKWLIHALRVQAQAIGFAAWFEVT